MKDKANELFNTISYLRNGIHGDAYDSVSQMSAKMSELLHGVEKRSGYAFRKLEQLKKFHSIVSEVRMCYIRSLITLFLSCAKRPIF